MILAAVCLILALVAQFTCPVAPVSTVIMIALGVLFIYLGSKRNKVKNLSKKRKTGSW